MGLDIRGLLSDPMVAVGAGLLDSTGTYGNFGSALQKGLLAGQAMQTSNLNQKAKAQLNQMRQQQMEAQQKAIARQQLLKQQMASANQPQPFKQDLFPGEQPTPGLLSNPDPRQVGQKRMGLLNDYVLEVDPIGYYNNQMKLMQPKPLPAKAQLAAWMQSPQGMEAMKDPNVARMIKSSGVNIIMPNASELKSESLAHQMDVAAQEEEKLVKEGNTELSTFDYIVNDYAPQWAKPLLTTDEGLARINMMSNWGMANLRDESGAVLSAEEQADMLPRYFPLQGDSDAVKKQKARARRAAEQAQRIRAGRASGTAPIAQPVEPAVPASSDIDSVKRKYGLE